MLMVMAVHDPLQHSHMLWLPSHMRSSVETNTAALCGQPCDAGPIIAATGLAANVRKQF